MASIREYFDTACKDLSIHMPWSFHDQSGALRAEVIARIAFDFEANAKFWYLYVPADTHDLSALLGTLIDSPEIENCRLTPDGNGAEATFQGGGDSQKQVASSLKFTKRINLYIDFAISPENRVTLVAEFLARGYSLVIRDQEYARNRSESERPLAFISHDSRDKDAFVRELAQELSKQFCPVWYDEYSLNVGDSLRASIEKGLKETRKCIVVLSPNFLSNKGWGQAEFDSIYTREIVEKKNVILPVWLNVAATDVYEYSPRLADKVGISATLGPAEVARLLVNQIKNQN